MSNYLKTRLSEMTQNQIKIMNGTDNETVQSLMNARTVLCTLRNQDANIALISRKLALLGY